MDRASRSPSHGTTTGGGPHETGGLTTQDETRDEALANLDGVIDAVEDDAGRRPTDEELRAAGIDPGANRRAGSGELPDVLE